MPEILFFLFKEADRHTYLTRVREIYIYMHMYTIYVNGKAPPVSCLQGLLLDPDLCLSAFHLVGQNVAWPASRTCPKRSRE